MADLSAQLASNNIAQVLQRLCLNPAAMAAGAKNIVTVHWPELFGLESQPLTDFGIESTGRQGFPGVRLRAFAPYGGIPAHLHRACSHSSF